LAGRQRYHLFFTTLMLLAFALQSFSQLLILADYHARTAAYAKACINKARPKLKCKGQCQMMKKMAEEEKQEQNAPGTKSPGKFEPVLSSRSFFVHLPVRATTHKHSEFARYAEKPLTGPVVAVFHPPAS
jgi:hypothetical protein